MREVDRRRRGWGAAGALIAVALALAGCATSAPAPVVNGERGPPPTQIIVQRGQTLSGIAHAYHVPMAELADANRLGPPYRIFAGQALILPAAGGPGAAEPTVAMAEPTSPPPSSSAPQGYIYASPPPAAPLPPAPPISAQPLPSVASIDRPPPAAAAKPPVVAAPPAALTPPESATSPVNPPPSSKQRVAALPPSDTQEPSGLPAPGRPAGAVFLWPVRGHVVEGFGVGPDGTHNDGINIAAPRGAAIEATDGGVVAYSGNELRGYGNLILIKHPGGWISAYAHCDLILVKTGQKVVRGQVIARVGASGNVSEPQLHFELRRGKKPVDPREYLVPLSATVAKEGHPT